MSLYWESVFEPVVEKIDMHTCNQWMISFVEAHINALNNRDIMIDLICGPVTSQLLIKMLNK